MPPTPTPTPNPPPNPAPTGSARRRPLLLSALAVAVLALAAVVYTALSPATTHGVPTSGNTGGKPGAAAPVSLSAATAGGGQVSVPNGKPSAVMFFSATCGTCGPATHALATAQQGDPQGANYVAVDLDPSESPADIAAFLTANQASTLATTSDINGQLTRTFGVTQLSTAVFLAPDGHVLSRTVEPTTTQIRDQLRTAATQ